MFRLMGVNRHSYYSYQRRERKRLADPDKQNILDWIKKVSEASRPTYGARRLKKALNALGYPIGIRKTKRFMKEQEKAGYIWLLLLICFLDELLAGV